MTGMDSILDEVMALHRDTREVINFNPIPATRSHASTVRSMFLIGIILGAELGSLVSALVVANM